MKQVTIRDMQIQTLRRLNLVGNDFDGFLATMREMYSRYHLPMIVTENGLGAYDTLEDGHCS